MQLDLFQTKSKTWAKSKEARHVDQTVRGDSPSPGQILRDKGIERAVYHAEEEEPGWHDQALFFLKSWIESAGPGAQFMAEDIRLACGFHVKLPPTERAWGAVILAAVRKGWIRRVGFRAVTNSKAHCTPASVWEIKI